MMLPIFTSLKQGKGTQAHSYVVSWSSCPWMQWRWSWKMTMLLCLFILATILDMSIPKLETSVGVFLVIICVLVVYLGTLKPNWCSCSVEEAPPCCFLPEPLLILKDGRLFLVDMLGFPCSESSLRNSKTLNSQFQETPALDPHLTN